MAKRSSEHAKRLRKQMLLALPREVIADGGFVRASCQAMQAFRTSRLLRWNLVALVPSQDEDQVWLAIPYIYYFENVSVGCALRHVARV
jgi:hypothetical protein